MPLFVVDTIVTTRNQYVIEADKLQTAFNEITRITEGNDDDVFEPVSRKYIGETILDGRKISKKQFEKLVADAEEDEVLHWMGDELIHRTELV